MEAVKSDEPLPTERNPTRSPHWRQTLSLWLGLLLPPSAWAIQLQAVYAMAPYACLTHRTWPMHLTSVGLLLLSLFGGLLAYRDWRHLGGGWPTAAEGDVLGRSRFLSVMGLMSASLFSLVICGQWVYVFAINPCVE